MAASSPVLQCFAILQRATKGQSHEDTLQIEETIRHYFEEQVNEDFYYLKNMTHPGSVGEIISKKKGGKQVLENGGLLPLSPTSFFSDALGSETADRDIAEALELWFLFFDLSDQSILVKARHKDLDYFHYIDLAKKNEQWQITQVFWSRE